MVMEDARIREQSQLQRAGIKRPWDEPITLLEEVPTRYLGRLPAFNEIAQRSPSNPQGIGARPILSSPYGPDARGPVAKRTKLEENENTTCPRTNVDFGPVGPESPRRRHPPSPINPTYSRNLNSTVFESTFPSRQTFLSVAAESPEETSSCGSCRLTTQDEATDPYRNSDSCARCSNNPEYSRITQTAASALTQLVETLLSGICSEKRGVSRRPRLYASISPECVPLSQFGLKHTLYWILGRIDEINSIADDLVMQASAGTSPWSNKELWKDGPQDLPTSNTKRQADGELDESSKVRSDAEAVSDARTDTLRRSSTTTSLLGEELTPVIRPHLDYILHGHPPRITFKNLSPPPPPPPPTPSRQLPSPPGRSLAIPLSLSFPSPSTSSSGTTPQSVNLPTQLSLHTSASNNYLPPISTSHHSDTALRDYSASLQHEVSVQKIALSSLQGEHDKLLAAFSRSQLRASALEKKHAVSDNELINLIEEKVRLQQQIAELERDVDELSRSRDDFRKAAVQEGSQYVEIVKKATRLEEIAGEERRNWSKMKDDMERKIERLGGENLGTFTNIVSSDTRQSQPIVLVAPGRIAEDVDIDITTSSIALPLELKVESPGETCPADLAPVEVLRDQVRSLQARCREAEDALRAIRDGGRSMQGILRSLLEKAGSTQLD